MLPLLPLTPVILTYILLLYRVKGTYTEKTHSDIYPVVCFWTYCSFFFFLCFWDIYSQQSPHSWHRQRKFYCLLGIDAGHRGTSEYPMCTGGETMDRISMTDLWIALISTMMVQIWLNLTLNRPRRLRPNAKLQFSIYGCIKVPMCSFYTVWEFNSKIRIPVFNGRWTQNDFLETPFINSNIVMWENTDTFIMTLLDSQEVVFLPTRIPRITGGRVKFAPQIEQNGHRWVQH